MLIVQKNRLLNLINQYVSGRVAIGKVLRLIADILYQSTDVALESGQGWADYADGQYTSGSPFILTTAAGKVNLPNNGLSPLTRTQYLPINAQPFYDIATQKLNGVTGNAYHITMNFKVRPTQVASDIRIYVSIDIGGTIGEIYQRELSLTKGSGVEHYYLSSFMYYTLDTFEANGGQIKVQAFSSNLEIYDIRYVISRLYDAETYATNNNINGQ